jgi:CubicO group peptidase (beta-lactamase class C family)
LRLKQLEELLQQGVRDRVFGEAAAVVRHNGEVVFADGDVRARFDIASVTKVMATTALVCRLGVDPSMRVGEVFPDAAVADATVADLLYHRSGLQAWDPFFARCRNRDELLREVLLTPRSVVGSVYSDLGLILLGELLRVRYGDELDVLFVKHVAGPLGLARSSYRRVSHPPLERTVPTGGTRPREPAPGQEGMWSIPSGPSRDGDVDDDNAYVMDGVAGHAGLFASADDVARYGQAILDGAVRSPLGWDADASTPGSTRAFGFDTPSAVGASCGRLGPRAIGHLGFTGTSLWIDRDRDLVVALLTNRVIYGRANLQIRAFRPAFHDAVLDVLKL